MSNYKQYAKCIKEVLANAFKDKKIRLSFVLSVLVLIVGILSNLSIPLLLKKIVESFNLQNGSYITLILLSYGLIWIISQTFDHVRILLAYKIEQDRKAHV